MERDRKIVPEAPVVAPKPERAKATGNSYQKPSICAMCKGKCCTSYAGIYAPSDFEDEHMRISVSGVLELLNTGKFTIDFDEGNIVAGDYVHFLRPRHLDEDICRGGYQSGTCINWSYDKGCGLSFDKRPYQCRKFIPVKKKIGYGCKYLPEDEATKDQMINKWLSYQTILLEAKRKYLSIKNNGYE